MKPLSPLQMELLQSLILATGQDFTAAVTMQADEKIKIERQSVFALNQWHDTDLDTFRARVSTDDAEFTEAIERLKNGECVTSISGTFMFREKKSD